jgi:hypothetical protein
MKKRNEFTANDYHTVGRDQAGKYPEWRAGNEFRAIREAQLKAP